MDKDRQIRFLYPPLFFLSFLWWAYNPQPIQTIGEYLKNSKESQVSMDKILGIIAGGSVAVLVLGFLIGTISAVVLRILFCFKGNSYETVLSPEALDRLWPKFNFKKINGKKLEAHNKWTLYAAATFDHSLLPKGIHEWIMRRWSAFIISINSFVGLVIVVVIAALDSNSSLSTTWWCIFIMAEVVLLINGIAAWKDSMAMLDFQSYRKIERINSGDKNSNPEEIDNQDEDDE